MKNNKVLSKTGILFIIRNYLKYLLIFIIFYITTDHLNFIRIWILLLILITNSTIIIVVLYKLNPESLNQRGGQKRDSKKWDIVIGTLSYYFSFYITLIIGFLDIGKFNWSYIPTIYAIFGIVIYIIMMVISAWAIVVNVHFEKFVRIQKDKNHKTVDNGPYKYVRHPSYSAGIFRHLSVPAIIGSIYAYIPVLLGICFLIIRTYLEDKTLQKELIGYKEYIKKTRYRLIPKIW